MVQCKKITCFSTLFILVLMLATMSMVLVGETDKSLIPRLKWMGPGQPGTMAQYREAHPVLPFKVNRIEPMVKTSPETFSPGLSVGQLEEKGQRSPLVLNQGQAAAGEKLLVLVNETLYPSISSFVNRYVTTLSSLGYTVELQLVSGGTPESLKQFIQQKQANLVGAIFIGHLPVAWFEEPDEWGPDEEEPEFPCDLFFMDLDGEWQDTNMNGIYDLHQDGNGDQAVEIFVARIDASTMVGNEVEIMSQYFEKDHRYWTGNMNFYAYGLAYTEDDWDEYPDFSYDIAYLYGRNYKNILAPDTSKSDYQDLRLNNPAYEFIQLSCHSTAFAHFFTRGGELSTAAVRELPPCALGYNLFCCSGARFTETNFLAGSYVFNQGSKPLVVVGSSKTGSMLDFLYFYQPLGENKPIGVAFKTWFAAVAPYDNDDLSWFYGMSLIGDPLISFRNNDPSMPAPVFPPLNVTISQQENRSFLVSETINIITWEINPVNQEFNHTIAAYRVYEVNAQGDVVELVGEIAVGPEEIQFFHRGIDVSRTYRYGVSAVSDTGRESQRMLSR